MHWTDQSALNADHVWATRQDISLSSRCASAAGSTASSQTLDHLAGLDERHAGPGAMAPAQRHPLRLTDQAIQIESGTQMNANARSVIQATFEASNTGQIHCGEVIARLSGIRVEAHHVDYRSGRTTR